MNTRHTLISVLVASLGFVITPAAMADRYESHRYQESYRHDYHQHKRDRHDRHYNDRRGHYEEHYVVRYYPDRPYDTPRRDPRGYREPYDRYNRGTVSLNVQIPVR